MRKRRVDLKNNCHPQSETQNEIKSKVFFLTKYNTTAQHDESPAGQIRLEKSYPRTIEIKQAKCISIYTQ